MPAKALVFYLAKAYCSSGLDMVEIKEKEKAIIEFTCIPGVDIERAQKLYEAGFKHLREFLEFTLDPDAKEKGLVDVLNHRILSHYLNLEDESVPSRYFKCPFCMGTIYADEEECEGCGALLLEEVLEVEIEDVYSGLREMIDTVISNPARAEKFLEVMGAGEGEETALETAAEEPAEEEPEERGFAVAPIFPKEGEGNYILVVSPLGEHEEERGRFFEDLKALGASEAEDFSISGGNTVNRQEEAVSSAVTRFIKEQDLESLGVEKLFILNVKIAKFWDAKATITVEDNRHFLSNLEGIKSDDEDITDVSHMLYDAELIKQIRKTGENFVMDEFSFNNDPLSFLFTRESIPFAKEHPGLLLRLLDVVINTSYLDEGSHNELVRKLLEW
ncbi:MAG: hypothetical protein JSW28_01590 [Thermoplasmata archaeon]|nr:MAG: hypothetical protein JSW28_01590 [Thermoplasmata archaeon]